MEYENVRVPKLKALARERRLRRYSQMRKTELVALLQNNGTPEGPRAAAPHTRPPPSPPQRHAAYVTLKLDDKSCCKIHSVSDGYKEIVTTERYVVMPWKMVNRHGKNGKNGKNVTLEEAVHEIVSCKEFIDKECERREIEHAEIEAK